MSSNSSQPPVSLPALEANGAAELTAENERLRQLLEQLHTQQRRDQAEKVDLAMEVQRLSQCVRQLEEQAVRSRELIDILGTDLGTAFEELARRAQAEPPDHFMAEFLHELAEKDAHGR